MKYNIFTSTRKNKYRASKKITILLSSLLMGGLIYGQQTPTGTASTDINWRRGGNLVCTALLCFSL